MTVEPRTTRREVLPPEPVRDLAWSAARAREFADRAVDLWQELLERLPDLPIAPSENAVQVAARVALDIPSEPLPDDALFDHLREVIVDSSTLTGHPAFMAYISGAGTV